MPCWFGSSGDGGGKLNTTWTGREEIMPRPPPGKFPNKLFRKTKIKLYNISDNNLTTRYFIYNISDPEDYSHENVILDEEQWQTIIEISKKIGNVTNYHGTLGLCFVFNHLLMSRYC